MHTASALLPNLLQYIYTLFYLGNLTFHKNRKVFIKKQNYLFTKIRINPILLDAVILFKTTSTHPHLFLKTGINRFLQEDKIHLKIESEAQDLRSIKDIQQIQFDESLQKKKQTDGQAK